MIPILSWTEWMWKFTSDEYPIGHYLGEAGNSGQHPSQYSTAMRIGTDVLVQVPAAWRRDDKNQTIPASTIAKGFGDDKDGHTLAEIMIEGVHYDHRLRPMS